MLNPRLQLPESILPPSGTEAAAHLASLHQALRTADLMAGKPASETAVPVDIAQVWPEVPAPTRRCFDARAGRAARAAAGCLEVMLAGPVHPAAAAVISDELRAGIAAVERLFAGR